MVQEKVNWTLKIKATVFVFRELFGKIGTLFSEYKSYAPRLVYTLQTRKDHGVKYKTRKTETFSHQTSKAMAKSSGWQMKEVPVLECNCLGADRSSGWSQKSPSGVLAFRGGVSRGEMGQFCEVGFWVGYVIGFWG
jgi:hypothetical protein